MIEKLSNHKIKTLTRISASQYYSALGCPYKLVLANTFGYKQLLPSNANAHFGSVIHDMIELISKGIVNNEQIFSETWISLIGKKESELKEKGLSSLTPLKYFVNDFALKKNQVKRILLKKQEKLNSTSKSSSNKYYAEKRLENPEKSIIGIADLIIENEFGTTIIDFKTGKIFSDSIDESGITEQGIKKEYEIQLKIYAHLYSLMTGSYPKSLFLVTLANEFVEVEFTESDCEKIYSEALSFLSIMNSHILKNDFASIAKPSVENCKYCSSRPACSFYSAWLPINFEVVNDLFGTIEKVSHFNNDTVGLQLEMQGKQVLINSLPVEMKQQFESLIGKSIILYNLKKSKQSLNATAGSFTVVYE